MFIPLKDLNPRRTYPVVNTLLILSNVIVFLYELTLPPRQQQVFELANATIPNHIRLALNGHGSLEAAFLPLFTSMFMHSGFLHIFVAGVSTVGAVATGGVAWWAHIGGFLMGMVITGLSLGDRKQSVNYS
jgi:membrane associated rhomboid family serine protease